MKTAGRENPNHGVALPRNRAHGAGSQNKSRSSEWAEKQEKFQPKERCFFLTSPFIDASSDGRRNTLQTVVPIIGFREDRSIRLPSIRPNQDRVFFESTDRKSV